MNKTRVRVRYRPAKVELGGNMDAGAYVEVLDLDCGPIVGIVPIQTPSAPLGDLENINPSFFPALREAAKHASNGRSGVISINLEDFLPW